MALEKGAFLVYILQLKAGYVIQRFVLFMILQNKDMVKINTI